MESVHILVVEDNLGDARLVEEMLTASKEDGVLPKFHLRQCDTLEKALMILEKEPIELIILDPGLPDSNGFDTFRRVRSQCRKIPIIIVTGNLMQGLGSQYVNAGAQDYLIKGEVNKTLFVDTILCSMESSLKEKLAQTNRRFRAVIPQKNGKNQWIDATLHDDVFEIAMSLGWTTRNIMGTRDMVVDFVVFKSNPNNPIETVLLHQKDFQNRPKEVGIATFLNSKLSFTTVPEKASK
jgi:CheY-like chemotaxis protein